MRAIQHANKVLDWAENLEADEMPPEWMWPWEEELDSWFETVKQKREERFSGGSTSSDDSGGPMLQNEYARGRG